MSKEDNILDMLPLVAEQHNEDLEPDSEPAIDVSSDDKPNTATPRELAALARVSPADARSVFARVKPSSWLFQLWVEDLDSDLNATQESNEPLAGMIQPLRRKMPVCHAQPDLLTWLQTNGHTGPVAIEFSERNSTRKPEQLFLHIPERSAQPNSHSESDGAAQYQPAQPGSGPAFGGTAAVLQQMMIQMQQQQAENLRVMAEVTRESRKDTSEMMAAMLSRVEQMNENQNQHNPMTELGEKMHAHALKTATEQITDMGQGGLAGVKRVIEDGKLVQAEVAKMLPEQAEKEEGDEAWDFVVDLGKDVIRSKFLGSTSGGNTGNAAPSGDDAAKSMLSELGAQGNDILNEGG